MTFGQNSVSTLNFSAHVKVNVKFDGRTHYKRHTALAADTNTALGKKIKDLTGSLKFAGKHVQAEARANQYI